MLVVCETPLLNTSYYEAPRGLVDSIPFSGWRPPAARASPALICLIVLLLVLEIPILVSGSPSLGTRWCFLPKTIKSYSTAQRCFTPSRLDFDGGRNPRGVRDARDLGQARLGLHSVDQLSVDSGGMQARQR